MGLRDLLSPSRMDRRVRSEGRSEVGSIEEAGRDFPAVQRRAESTPDLGTDPSTLPTPSPSIIQDQGSSSMQTTLSRMII